ncbi:hypothetical protein PR003_g22837 [Phytophthora rubi]|uniref:RxLR effector protein n=2 Tax=Phytophthora TaxID=4783 RepID=A0A6A3IWF4_9STRA|nr:hypothetical protein PR002_g22363 [Phytophthora rubi]KAE8989683.1 hypothetical protein PR001_g21706 [Phytophthora rubi]KAE9300050.1 hypothetical protein PR003_g22837 [Phytophthora rubi]
MRLSYILLAAAATLLASGNVASAATALSNTQISEVATADLVQSINTGARRLRSARFADVDGDSDDDNDDDDREEVADREERANFSKSQISKMLDDTAYMNKKFKKWDEGGWAHNDTKKHAKNTWLLRKYREYLGI